MRQPVLLIRADANVAIGTGHVMRCLALAQAWQEAGGSVLFGAVETTPSLRRRLQAEGIEIKPLGAEPGGREDARATLKIVNAVRADWIVVDGYQFGANYQRAIKSSSCKLLFVDDNGHAADYCADVVLNQNAHANESLYIKREPYTHLLLGPHYAMLRREFWACWEWQREIRETGTRVLIAMGGTDPESLTQRIIEALENVHELRLEVLAIVGGSNPHLAEIESVSARSRHSIRVARDATNMPSLMAWADMAISAAGSICWEFCALALPALLTAVASNQVAAADTLQRMGAAKIFSSGQAFCPEEFAREVTDLITSSSERRSLSQRARTLVDTRGAARVVDTLCGEAACGMERP